MPADLFSAITWKREPHRGFCSLHSVPPMEESEAVRIVGRFTPRMSPRRSLVYFVALCVPCAKALVRPRPLGKETRAACLPGHVIKAYRPTNDTTPCATCLEVGAEMVAVWRAATGFMVMCDRCLGGMRATLASVSPTPTRAGEEGAS